MIDKLYLLDMKKDLNNSDKIVIRDLYESVDGLYAFTFYTRYKMSPSLMFKFIEKYMDKGILIFENGKIFLTSEGRNVAMTIVKNKKKSIKSKYNNIPIEFKDVKLKINSLYLPDKKKI